MTVILSLLRLLGPAAMYVAVLALIAVPLGRYIARVFAGENRADVRALGWLERLIYRLAGVDPAEEQSFQQYAFALLGFTLTTSLATYALLRTQEWLPYNPTRLPNLPPWLAFNTMVGFSTGAGWESFPGEATVSYFSQAVALVSQNFFAPAVGLSVAIALARGIARHERSTVGNFWVDLVRAHLYVLLPLCMVYALFLVSQGVVQTWAGPATWTTLDGNSQSLLRGPVAVLEAVKLLGTNGEGYFTANSAHPWENPTPLTNFIQSLSILAIPAALCFAFGEMVGHRRHGRALFIAMAILLLLGTLGVAAAEQHGNPVLGHAGADQVASTTQCGGNMEGKEVRFGVADTALYATVTTGAACGAVNGMHDSFTPLGGAIPLLNMQLGETIFGGVGCGFYSLIFFVFVAVFLAGLMIGRMPEYLGKRLEARDVRFAALGILIPSFTILIFTALGLMTDAGRAGILNVSAGDVAAVPWHPHPHGLSEVLYAYSSAAANNGSLFAGITLYSSEHPVFYSLTLALALFLGRFPVMVAVLALAGSLAQKKRGEAGPANLPVHGPLFVALLAGVILLVGALTFFPALLTGPMVEHLMLYR